MKRLFTKPQMYSVVNMGQRRDAKEAIEMLSPNIKKWKNETNSSLLDIGTGCGDVLIDFVVPKLSKNYRKVVGSDISEEMINFAKDKFNIGYPRVQFKILDISSENLRITEQFDHVTSFYCLNWVQNQRKAFKNIYDLVKPGGDIMVLLVAYFPFYSMLDLLAINPKWGPHLRDVSSYASPYRFSNFPDKDLETVLKEAGFHDIRVMFQRKKYIFDNDEFNSFLKIWDQFKPETPENYYKELPEAMLQIMREFDMVKEEPDGRKIILNYSSLMAYAQKE